MNKLITLVFFLSLISFRSYSQTVDFNKTYCKPDPHCAPFYFSPNLCDSPANTIVFRNLYGAPNYINWKKTTNFLGGRANARAVRFRSSYSWPLVNYGDALALKKNFIKNKIYNISIVASGLREVNHPSGVAHLRVSFDKVAAATHNGGEDSCSMGQYNQLPDSYYLNDITPPLMDTTVPFNEAIYTASYQTGSPDNYSFLGLRALPHSGVSEASLMVHKIVAQELNFKFKQSLTTLYCDVPATVTFTLSNPDKIFGVSEYHWELGPQPNGWYQGTTPAPQFITTSDTTLVLQWSGSAAPSKVKVVPYIGTTALAYLYEDAITYSAGFPPGLVTAISGASSVCSGSNTYDIPGLNPKYSVTWSTIPANSNLVSLQTDPVARTVTVTKLRDGNITLQASIANSCNAVVVSTKRLRIGSPYFSYSVLGSNPVYQNAGYYYSLKKPYDLNAHNIVWKVPAGWTISNGQGTEVITAWTGTQGGAVEVDFSDDCGLRWGTYLTVSMGPGGSVPLKTEKRKEELEVTNNSVVVPYPNPVRDAVTVVIDPEKIGKTIIRIYTVDGKEIRKMNAISQRTNINIAGIAKGVYFVQLSDGQSVNTYKIIKN